MVILCLSLCRYKWWRRYPLVRSTVASIIAPSVATGCARVALRCVLVTSVLVRPLPGWLGFSNWWHVAASLVAIVASPLAVVRGFGRHCRSRWLLSAVVALQELPRGVKFVEVALE